MRKMVFLIIITLINSLIVGVLYYHNNSERLGVVKLGDEYINEVIKTTKHNRGDLVTNARSIMKQYPQISRAVILRGSGNRTYNAEILTGEKKSKNSFSYSIFKSFDGSNLDYIGVMVEIKGSISYELAKTSTLSWLFTADIIILLWLLCIIYKDSKEMKKMKIMMKDSGISDFSFIYDSGEKSIKKGL